MMPLIPPVHRRGWVLHALLGMLCVGAIFILPRFIRLGEDLRTVVPPDREPQQVQLAQGHRLTQEFRAPDSFLRGIRVYAVDGIAGRTLQLRILDAQGRARLLATSFRVLPENDYVLQMDLPRLVLRTKPGEPLTVELTLLRGEPIGILVANVDVTPHGMLMVDGQEDPARDLAFAVARPGQLSHSTRRGLFFGVIVLLGYLLIERLPQRFQRIGMVCLLAGLVPLVLSGFLFPPLPLGISDWDRQFLFAESVRQSISVHGAVPLWNPYLCGGTAGLADPELPLLSPILPFILTFGVSVGLRSAVVVFFIVGLLGVTVLARRLGLAWQGTFLASLIYIFGSRLLLHTTEGHLGIVLPALLLPWLWWAFLKSVAVATDRRQAPLWILLAAAFLASMVFLGGSYVVVYAVASLIALALGTRHRWNALRHVLFICGWAIALAAVKLLPALFWLREIQDVAAAPSHFVLPWLPEILLGRHSHGAMVIPGEGPGWHEIGSYVGGIALLMAFLGTLHAWRSRTTRLLILGILLVVLMASSGPLLTSLFGSFTVIPRSNISRFMILGTLLIGLLAGKGIDVLKSQWRTSLFVGMLLVVSSVELLGIASTMTSRVFRVPDTTPPLPSPAFFDHTHATVRAEVGGRVEDRAYTIVRAGYGTLAPCGETSPSLVYNQRSRVQSIENAPAPFAGLRHGQGSVTIRAWSPSLVRVHAATSASDRLFLNTNMVRGWMVNGKPAEESEGLVSVSLPSGEHDVEFRYRPPGLPVGMTISLFALAAALCTVFSRRTIWNFFRTPLLILSPSVLRGHRSFFVISYEYFQRFRVTIAARWLPVLLASVVLGGSVLAMFLPIQQVTVPAIRPPQHLAVLLLDPGDRLRQEVGSPGGRLSGVEITVPVSIVSARGIHARILDGVTRQVLSEGHRAALRYHGLNTLVRLPFPSITATEHNHFIVEIVNNSSESLPIQVSHANLSTLVRLWRINADGHHTEELSQDLPFSFSRQERPDAELRMTIGSVVAALLFVILISAIGITWKRAALLLIVLTPILLGGIFHDPGAWGISDWDYYSSLHETYRSSILHYHVFPLWNPYICGGTAALGDPEFSVISPIFLLELLFGVPWGVRLGIVLSVATSAVGMLVLSRRLGLSVWGGFLTAVVAAFGSVSLLELVEGHVNIFATMWIPWMFWAWHCALHAEGYRRRIFSLLCGVLLALIFFRGGIYLLLYIALAFIGLMLLVRRQRDALIVSVSAILWALGLAAVKLLPTLFWLRNFPDMSYASSGWMLPWMPDILFGRHLHGATILPFQEVGWHEYGAYIGPVALFCILLAFSRLQTSRRIRLLLFSAIIVLFISSLGPLLKPLFDLAPFFPRSNISRIILFAVLPLSLLAGMGIDAILARRRFVSFVVPIVLLVLIDIGSLAHRLSQQPFVVPPAPLPSPAAAPFRITTDTFSTTIDDEKHTRAYAATLAGYGTLSYCSVLGPTPKVHTIYDEDGGSWVSLRDKKGVASVVAWSPNRAVVHVRASVPDTVVLNTNFAPGWTVNGYPVENDNGRVAAPVPEGVSTLRFSYRPPGLIVGIILSTLTLLLAIRMAVRARWLRKTSRAA